ncbi:unnamed protein product [Calypogeia fissa]
MKKRAAEEQTDAPPGFTTVIATKVKPVVGVKPQSTTNTLTMRGATKALGEAKDKPTSKLKIILKPNPKPKPNQPGTVKARPHPFDKPEDQTPPSAIIEEVAPPP